MVVSKTCVSVRQKERRSARRKRLFSFLNDIPNNEIPKYFDGVKHDEYRLMLRNSAFELLIDEEIFVAVMN